MKYKKYIICSGLAFSDNKDMENLHAYALDGWIFRKLRFGLLYELHKEEPQDMIFSYDLQKIKNDEKEDYLRCFEESGWHLIGKWDKGVRFFHARNNTPPVHSEIATRSEQYRKMLYTGIAIILLGILCSVLAIHSKEIWFAGLAGACFGGGITLTIGCYMRTRGKSGNLNLRSYKHYLFELVLGIVFLVSYILLRKHDRIMVFVLIMALCCICASVFGMYRVSKEKKMKERVHL